MVFGKPVVSMLNPSKVTLLIFKVKLVIIVVEQGIDILCKISVFTFDKVNAFSDVNYYIACGAVNYYIAYSM